MAEPRAAPATEAEAACPRCGKPPALCVCADIEPVANQVALLILQHPQEQDVELGTARLAALSLAKATIRVGLSWPNLAAAVGRPAEPRRWGIVYLGSARAADELVAVDRAGEPLARQAATLAALEGVVLLDGSWSQAKALWWRNPWMLKSPRLLLGPRQPSHYGRLRREPRADGLSTIEAAGLALARLEGRPEIEAALLARFDALLAAYRRLHPPRDRRRRR